MDSLRVNNGVKKIEVNDKGEYIEIPISDTAFYERYAGILKYFKEKKADIEKQEAELSEKYKDRPDDDVATISDTIAMYSELCKEVCAEIDKLFGTGCCKKVFVGIEVPGVELIGDFFEQITPFLNKYMQEQSDKINLKYNRNRKGAHSK